MGAKLLPDAKSFSTFTKALEGRGFRRLSNTEFQRDWRRLGLEAPSPREGREVGLSFAANGLEVLVWTTFLAQQARAREKDAGWVLIKDGDEVKYFSHPMHRTKNYLRNLLWMAVIAKWRVEHRPLCPECDARMDIANGRSLKARYWKCVRPAFHKKYVSLSWDHGLPQAALDFLKPLRKKRERYRSKRRKEDKKPGVALKKRKRWKVGRPENIVSAR